MRARGEDGAAAVEFALVVIPLIMIVFGIIAFGIVFAQVLSLNNAAREAARAGVVRTLEGTNGRTCADVLGLARASASAIAMPQENVAVSVSVGGTTKCSVAAGAALSAATGSGLHARTCAGTTAGTQLTVTTTYRSSVVIPLVPLPTMTLTGTGVFKCEYST